MSASTTGAVMHHHHPAHTLALSASSTLTSPLLADPAGPAHSSSHGLSHIIHTRLDCPPPLFDVAPAVRSLIWQYVDNQSAVQYLLRASSCTRCTTPSR